MDFSLSEEQSLLKASVERFVSENYGLEERSKYLSSESGFSPDCWAQFAELGWLALPFPEDVGGLEGSAADLVVLMEALGGGMIVEPYLATVLLGGAALADAAAGQPAAEMAELIGRIIGGDLLLALGYLEPGGRHNPAYVRTRAVAADGGYRLDGNKHVVLHGAKADMLVVTARTSGDAWEEQGISLFLIDAGAQGLESLDYHLIDGTSAASISLNGVMVEGGALLGPVGGGYSILSAVLDRAILAVSAEAVGAMQAVFDATVEYVGVREQFNQPIGSFQAVRHRIADMFMVLEQTRSAVLAAALTLDAGRTDAQQYVANAKAFAGRYGKYIGEQAIQLHGGMGMTDELAVSHYYKRLMTIDMLFGDTVWQARHFREGSNGGAWAA